MPQYPGCQKETTINGNTTKTRYTKGGKLIATKEVVRDVDGRIEWLRWRDANGRLHLESKKSTAVHHDIARYSYWHGLLHSYDDIASSDELASGAPRPVTKFNYTGKECWHKYGQLHRKNGPAVKEYVDGKLVREEWYKNGLLHRKCGPAILWLRNGMYSNRWFIHDAEIFGEDVEPMRTPPEVLSAFEVLPMPIEEAIAKHYWHWRLE